ncbi:MAG: LPS-assembly protein LptD [Cognatishimia sp.]|uniref:LPS-assembly protein LptD n=1 Tax=Cognatishimia sp. TaxID=2211648 RepID=UPI003B8D1AC5
MTRFRSTSYGLAVALCLGLSSTASVAQDIRAETVVLVANSVFLSGNSMLTAVGNVEALYGNTTLTASKIIYDGNSDQITIEGPITISDGEGVEIFANFAELDADLQNGLIKSARLVLDQQVEIKAAQLRRENGRRSVLDDVRATSCKTCEDGQAPLWQIRASRVTHDQDDQQLYFDNAQLRVMDIPVFYLPRLRLPDPTVQRSTGFLIPNIRARSQLGTGIKIPYFIALGDHKDLTLTPYIASNTRTLEARYRQAFRTGELTFEGAVSDDDFSGRGTRAYVFGTGEFDLPRDYELTFQVQAVSDESYLADYAYSSLDRLSSSVTLSRVNRNENTQLSLTNFETLRAGEDNETIPKWALSARKQMRFSPRYFGGEALWELEAYSLFRQSKVNTDANGDGMVDGRDISRVNAALEWRRNWFLSGLEIGAQTALNFDAVQTRQDSTIAQTSYAELTPSAALSFRYPLIKRGSNGVTTLLEPIAQIGWSGGTLRAGTQDQIANEESTRPEFDEGNLLALSRFASDDRRERGFASAWGVNWSRLADDWSAHLTLGQVVREETHPDFTTSSGLSNLGSDFLVAAKFKNASGLEFQARSLIDGIDGLNKAEVRGGWNNEKLGLDATYIWLDADPAEDRLNDLSEWNLDGSYRMHRHWTGLANWRYDVAARTTAEAGFGLEYQNECLKAKFEVSRRFTSSTSIQPATDYSFTVEILGFSTKTIDKSYARTCAHTAG